MGVTPSEHDWLRLWSMVRQNWKIQEVSELCAPGTARFVYVDRQPRLAAALLHQFGHLLPHDIQRAVPARQAEFLVGRVLASHLLRELGCRPGDAWIGRRGRAPLWPAGYCGSITHSSAGLAVCASADTTISVGIDLEVLDQPFEEGTVSLCFRQEERATLGGSSADMLIGFSLKESLFKSINPVAGVYFDFLDALVVEHSPGARRASLELAKDIGPYSASSRFSLRYRRFRSDAGVEQILSVSTVHALLSD